MKKITLTLALCLLVLSAAAQGPLIGLVCGHSSSGNNGVGDYYVQAVVKAGGVPVLVPTMFDKASAEEVVSKLDGILFTGGEDVDPAWYGEEINGAVDINGLRDTSEIYMINQAVQLGIPILGICRGCQVINVALGGTLVQDIPTQVKTKLKHKQSEPGTQASHYMTIEPGSHMASLLGVKKVKINSLHHEAVKTPAPGLKVVCLAEDGVVEGYEGLPFLNIVAVQFHPEKLIGGGDEFFLPIFKDLVERAKKFAE